jgi:hypothetical protein
MARTASGNRINSSWMMWAFWAAGVSLLLVQVQVGMEYVEAGLQENLAGLLGTLPAMGMITLKVAEHSVWHWSGLQLAMQSVPMAAMGFLLVMVACLLNHSSSNSR